MRQKSQDLPFVTCSNLPPALKTWMKHQKKQLCGHKAASASLWLRRDAQAPIFFYCFSRSSAIQADACVNSEH